MSALVMIARLAPCAATRRLSGAGSPATSFDPVLEALIIDVPTVTSLMTGLPTYYSDDHFGVATSMGRATAPVVMQIE